MYRLKNGISSDEKRKLGMYFRAAQYFHYWWMEIFRVILPVCVTGAELIIVFTLFASLRLHALVGTFIIMVVMAVGGICFIVFKEALEYASMVTESSRDFSRTPFLKEGDKLSQYERVFLFSCKPLVLRVGETFVITKETFPTISQDIILGNLINLLLTF